MSENFKKVVNLQSSPSVKTETRPTQATRRVVKKKKSRAEEIDQVFEDDEETEANGLHTINRPASRNENPNFFKQFTIILLVVIFSMVSYYFIVARKDINKPADMQINVTEEGDWYSVQLVSGEVYYGFLKDKSADPLTLENVYYNYNQLNETNGEDEKQANIRLVKRGKESHGPNGTMDIVRSQAMFMEVLGEDSKIRKAIIEYEQQ